MISEKRDSRGVSCRLGRAELSSNIGCDIRQLEDLHIPPRHGHFVIRLTCNESSKEAVENFRAALHVILHRITAEGAQTVGSQD